MKKTILLTAILAMAFIKSPAQEIFKEVQNLMVKFETVKNDTTKDLSTRLVATFKYDALYYLTIKAGKADNFSEADYGKQASAMIDFVNRYVKSYKQLRSKSKRGDLTYKYMSASVSNPLFYDDDKDVTNAYVGNAKYITNFSLDTDWVKAYEKVTSANN